jgi:hypothetical protein
MRRRRNQPPPTPRAIDPASGFKVPLSNLVRQYDGEMVDRRFADKRHPQDFVRGRADKMALPFARPEPPDRFLAQNILWENDSYMTQQNGAALLEEGEVVVL